jgi:cytochrome c oxidase subunit 2
VELTSGSVIADENYIRESIEKPQAKIVKGYGAGMPPYQGVLSETDLNELIAYIKTLK